MTDEPSDLDPQRLWQDQPKELDPMTLADIHAKARAFDSRIQRRNAIEYIACGVVIVGFIPPLLNPQSWMVQAGAALVILGVIFVAWQLHRRGSSDPTPQPSETPTAAYRRQLVRQRDALRTVGLWYIGPMVPGMLLLLLGMALQVHPRHGSDASFHARLAGVAGVTVLVFVGVWLLNLYGARRLQKRIDEL